MIRTHMTTIKGLVYRGIKHTARILHIKRRGWYTMGTYRGVEHRPQPTKASIMKHTYTYRGVSYRA